MSDPAVISIGEMTFPISATLGGVLHALIEAQEIAARTTLEYIKEIGMETDAKGLTTLRTTKVSYAKLDEDFNATKFELEIPLLALVPIPCVTIQKARVEFSCKLEGYQETGPGASKSETGTRAGGVVGKPLPTELVTKRLYAKPAALTPRIVQTAVAPAAGAVAAPAVRTENRSVAELFIEVEIESTSGIPGLSRLMDAVELAIRDAKVPPPPLG